MKVNPQIVGAVMFGVSSLLFARYTLSAVQQARKLATRKLAKQAVHAWEGEGGSIIDASPQPVAG